MEVHIFAHRPVGFFLAWPLTESPCPCRFSPFLKTALALRAEAARQKMEVIMQQDPILPITKSQRRAINDEKGSARYAKRTAIDSLLAERKLRKQLREVWDDPLHSA